MGVLWTVWPLDEQMTAWLDDQGIAYPTQPSRFPTGAEIRAVLSSFPGNVEVTENGDGGPYSAYVTQGMGEAERWTLLQVTEFTGNSHPQELWFEKGDEELIKDLLQRLTRACGPLALIADVGDPPQIINVSI